MLSKNAIDEFKQIMKEDYGQDLTDAEANEQGERLVRFFEILLKIDQREEVVKKSKQ